MDFLIVEAYENSEVELNIDQVSLLKKEKFLL